MVRRSTWWSTAIATAMGTIVGTGGWFLGLGKHFSPTHPSWALFWVTLAVTIIVQLVAHSTIEEEISYRNYLERTGKPLDSPRVRQH